MDDWAGMLRSATLARDLLHWSKGELRASGIGGDYAAALSEGGDDPASRDAGIRSRAVPDSTLTPNG